ncbi:proton-coupled folate transporter-like [Paramacrobiotus metropolitanus]|uniref:proton-coupled folate transporter-like n=1 Tax=Paramacrobiotus metropolitanus TaxID=2943436 RepID=UPI0024457C03|nr:proton-coupled folate transporter-like [Paramacrobiotus metropolitanus]
MGALTFDMDNKPESGTARRRSSFKYTPSKEDLLAVDNEISVDALPTYYTAIRMVPIMLCVGLATGTVQPVLTELIKIRTCQVELNFTDEICDHINNHTREAKAVQRVTSQIKMYETLIDSLPAMFFSLFLGSWSDEYGRKLPMMLPFVGLIIAHGFTLVNTYVRISPYFLMLTPFITAATGGMILVNVAVFSFVGDYTNDRTRSPNLAIVDAAHFLVRFAGSAIGGQLMRFGESVPFYLAISLHVCSFLYVFFVIHEKRTFRNIKECKMSDVITFERVKDNWRTLSKRRPGHNRLFLLLIIGCIIISAICVIGDMSITQLYLEFDPFNWTLQHYTLYNAINGVIEGVIMVLVNIVLRRFFTISDTMIGAIASLSAVMHLLFYGLATSSTLIYVAAGVGVLKMLGFVSIKSVTIALVDRDEIGKLMSTKMSLMSIAPFIGVTIFTNIFTHTNEWWPGFCFVLGACMTSPVVFVFLAFYLVQRRQAKSASSTGTTVSAAESLDDIKTKV